jgi:hypothetical protein
MMGRRVLVIADTMFPAFFGRGLKAYRVTKDALPDDARVIGARVEFNRNILLLVESAEWADEPGGNEPTRISPMMRDFSREVREVLEDA